MSPFVFLSIISAKNPFQQITFAPSYSASRVEAYKPDPTEKLRKSMELGSSISGRKNFEFFRYLLTKFLFFPVENGRKSPKKSENFSVRSTGVSLFPLGQFCFNTAISSDAASLKISKRTFRMSIDFFSLLLNSLYLRKSIRKLSFCKVI
jgi:hypothetical protein